MNQFIGKIARTGLLAVAIIALSPLPAFSKSNQIAGTFTGKVMCRNGQKKAEFKTSDTQNMTYYSTNEIVQQVHALTWPEPDNKMTFSEREDTKVQLQHALTLLRNLSCDTPPETPPENASPLPTPSQMKPE